MAQKNPKVTHALWTPQDTTTVCSRERKLTVDGKAVGYIQFNPYLVNPKGTLQMLSERGERPCVVCERQVNRKAKSLGVAIDASARPKLSGLEMLLVQLHGGLEQAVAAVA